MAAGDRLAQRYSRAVLRLRSALSRRIRPAPSVSRTAQESCWQQITHARRRSAALFRSFFPGQGTVRGGQTERPGRHSRQTPDSCYEERRTREWLKIKITQTAGLRDRRLHRSRGQPRIFRFDRAGPVRQEGRTHSRRTGGHRIRSSDAEAKCGEYCKSGRQAKALFPTGVDACEKRIG